jgi:hypothetical protein
MFCLTLAQKRLSSLHRINPSMGLKKLLVLSVLVVCFIRIMTFIGLTVMDVANVRAHYSPSPVNYHTYYYGNTLDGNADIDVAAITVQAEDEDGDDSRDQDHYQSFYDASMAVLFDLPNTIVVSTYILLTLVWAECFVQSRIHTVNTTQLKRKWMLGYTIFNSGLYFTQLVLYATLVFVSRSKMVKNVLYAGMTGINCCAVGLVTLMYFFLNIKFAGFPTRSPQAKKAFRRISKVLALWTVSRILWALIMLVVYVKGIELLHFSSVLLGFSFVACEIVPIVVMLDYSYMQIIGFERDESGFQSQIHSLVEQEFSGGDEHDGDPHGEDWLGGFDLNDSFGFVERNDGASNEPLLME